MNSIRLPQGRSGRAAVLAVVIAVTLGAGGLVGFAASLIDERTPGTPQATGASPALADVSQVTTTATPDAGAAQASGAPPSAVPRRSTAPAQPSVSAGWSLPPGWRYDLACDDEGAKCTLRLLDDAGTVQDGWPVALPGECVDDVAIGPRDEVFVPCTVGSQVVLTGLVRTGAKMSGWPIRLPGSVAWSTWNDFAWGGVASIGVGPDETVYLAVETPGDRGSYAIHALAPDGSPRAGWPRVLEGDAQGFTLAPDGMVVAWWYEGVEEGIGIDAKRTVVTTIRPDGHALAGWPIGSKGAASGPVAWDDGSIAYTSATGKVWAHDRSGSVIDGWPYQLPYPIAPTLRADGSLLFIGDSDVLVLDRDGAPVPGWPFRVLGTLAAPSCDMDSFSHELSVMTPEGVLYLAEWDEDRTLIVALGMDGQPLPGWPYAVPDGWRVAALELAGKGGVTASLSADPCGEGPNSATLRLDGDGRIVGDRPPPPPTRLERVYEALRLDPLRTTTGAMTFRQGDRIDLETALVNRSKEPVILPYVDDEDESYYAAGTLQTWLERLGPDAETACLPNAGRKDAWYATGGWIQVSSAPMTIPPGGRMGPLLQPSLWPDLTGCLPPGNYRYRVEYKPLDGEIEDVNDEASIDLTITAAGASPPAPMPSQPPSSTAPSPRQTPSPTPSPTPWVNRSPSPSPTGVP